MAVEQASVRMWFANSACVHDGSIEEKSGLKD